MSPRASGLYCALVYNARGIQYLPQCLHSCTAPSELASNLRLMLRRFHTSVKDIWSFITSQLGLVSSPSVSLAMLTKHGILGLLVALSALSSSVGQLTVQDSNPYIASGQRDSDAESIAPIIDTRQVFLDDGVFVGSRLGATDRFLGIPYAIPP